MIKSKRFSVAVAIAVAATLVVFILPSCVPAITPTAISSPPTLTIAITLTPILEETGLPPSPTVTPNPTQAKQQEDIKSVLEAYFEIRYQLLSVSPPSEIHQGVFGDLVSGKDDAQDFLALETAKLALERKWYELNGLRYAQYKYALKYKDIAVNPNQTVTISLLEDFEFIRESDANLESPSVTRGGEKHEIVLRDEEGQWKIISDIYWDGWWRQFRKPGASTEEILNAIHLEMQELEARPSVTPWAPSNP